MQGPLLESLAGGTSPIALTDPAPRRTDSKRKTAPRVHLALSTRQFAESGSLEVLTEGYVTEDNHRWICPDCFRDLREEMGWRLA
jgi:hypothetical protein